MIVLLFFAKLFSKISQAIYYFKKNSTNFKIIIKIFWRFVISINQGKFKPFLPTVQNKRKKNNLIEFIPHSHQLQSERRDFPAQSGWVGTNRSLEPCKMSQSELKADEKHLPMVSQKMRGLRVEVGGKEHSFPPCHMNI